MKSDEEILELARESMGSEDDWLEPEAYTGGFYEGFRIASGIPRALSSVPLTAKPSGERRCVCVTRHRPEPVILHSHHKWPLGEGGPDVSSNLLWVCPTSHNNIHELWRLMVKADKTGVPIHWQQLRRFSEYVRDVVAGGYAQAKEAGQVP